MRQSVDVLTGAVVPCPMRIAALLLTLAACSSSTVGLDATLVPVDAVPEVATQADASDAGGAQPCTAGRVEECPCGDGRRGTQTCQPSGSYGPCVCTDAAAAVPDVVAPAPDVPRPECVDMDGDGYGLNCPMGGDCNDMDSTIHPNVREACDGVDQDCDGNADALAVDAGQAPHDPAVNAYCESVLQPDGGAWDTRPTCVLPSMAQAFRVCAGTLVQPTCIACVRSGQNNNCEMRGPMVLAGRCTQR